MLEEVALNRRVGSILQSGVALERTFLYYAFVYVVSAHLLDSADMVGMPVREDDTVQAHAFLLEILRENLEVLAMIAVASIDKETPRVMR